MKNASTLTRHSTFPLLVLRDVIAGEEKRDTEGRNEKSYGSFTDNTIAIVKL